MKIAHQVAHRLGGFVSLGICRRLFWEGSGSTATTVRYSRMSTSIACNISSFLSHLSQFPSLLRVLSPTTNALTASPHFRHRALLIQHRRLSLCIYAPWRRAHRTFAPLLHSSIGTATHFWNNIPGLLETRWWEVACDAEEG